jgi:hypothetical protein
VEGTDAELRQLLWKEFYIYIYIYDIYKKIS